MKQFEKFSPEARAVLATAQEHAKQMRLPYIGTEHILLGILAQHHSAASRIMSSMGVTEEAILAILKSTPSHQVPMSQVIKKGLSELAKRTIEDSMVIAQRYGHNAIQPEHMLYALLNQRETAAVVLLESRSVDLARLRAELEQTFREWGQQDGAQRQMQDPFEMLFGSIIGDFFNLGGKRAGNNGPATIQRKFIRRNAPNAPDQTDAPGGVMPQQAAVASTVRSKETPALNYFTLDITRMAQEKQLDPVIGREKEIERVISILNRRTKNNPVLIGEAGVGKTAIAEGLAQRIADNNVPNNLADKRVLALDMAAVVAGTKYRGEFEERIKAIIEEAKTQGNILLFIDELHTVIGAGSSEGSLDAANILKPALSRSELQLIGATTTDEYRKHVETDAALERRFQPIMVDEPNIEDSIAILKGLRSLFEEHHHLEIEDSAIDAAVKLSKRYIGDRYLPDKAIDLIDEASSLKGIKTNVVTDRTRKIRNEISKIVQKKEEAVASQQYEKATNYRDQELSLLHQLEKIMQEEIARRSKNQKISVNAEDIATVIASVTGIPVTNLIKSEKERLTDLEKMLRKHIVGQDEALKEIAQAIRRARTGIANERRPIGSFIFLGPTGVGKTELVRALAREVYNDENALIKIDMSEFMERHNVSRLVGATAGYIGYEEGGQLTEAVRRKPYSVVLFDEIEKAHPEFFNILLQILEDGVLTDAKGKRVDFRNTIIIMTSNIGSARLTDGAKAIGFDVTSSELEQAEHDYKNIKDTVLDELKESFRPEFLNRVDRVVVFHPLKKEDLKKIIKLQLNQLESRIKLKGLSLITSLAAIKTILEQSYDPAYGARPIRRVIQDGVENQISEAMLNGELSEGDTAMLDSKKNQLVITKAATTKKQAIKKNSK